MWKKFIFISLICLLLAGCASSEGEETDLSADSQTETYANEDFDKNCIFKRELLLLEPPMETLSDVFCCGDKLYLLGSDSGDDNAAAGYNVIAVCEVDGSGMAEITRIPREWDEDSRSGILISDLWADTEGNLYLLEEHYTMITVADSTSVYKLVKLDGAGNQLWKTEEIGEERPGDMIFSEDHILLNAGLEIKIFDGDGKEAADLAVDGMTGVYQLFTSADGRAFVSGATVAGSAVVEIEVKKGRIGEELDVPWMGSVQMMTGHGGYDLFIQNTDMIAGYNTGDAEYTKLLDFIDSDMEISLRTLISAADEEHFLMSEPNQKEWYMLSKVAPEDVKEKQILTVGALYGISISQEILQFNQLSEDYRAVLRDYSEYNTTDNPQGGLTQLNNDIALGNAPDVLLVNNSQMPISSYVEKGVFEDLYPWLENDPDLSREDFLSNVLEAYSTDGKLYQFPAGFLISTAVGKTSVVGDRTSWTFSDAWNLQRQYPDSTVSGMWTPIDVLSYYITYLGGNYVDADAGTCSFDSPGFVELLEWAAEFQEEIDYADYWENRETLLWENKELLYFENFTNLYSLIHVRDSYFHEEIALIGFPVSEGSGSALLDYRNLAISADSSCKEGAWAFVKYFLSEDYQRESGAGFPVREDVLEEQIKAACDPNGIYSMESPLSEEEAAQYMDFIKSVSRTQLFDQELIEIVTEECQVYFAGEKTAEETAEVIQRRASLYMAENK